MEKCPPANNDKAFRVFNQDKLYLQLKAARIKTYSGFTQPFIRTRQSVPFFSHSKQFWSAVSDRIHSSSLKLYFIVTESIAIMLRNNRNRGVGLGVVLLLAELMNVGFGVIPPVTLGVIIGQMLLFMGMIQVPWNRWDVCISAQNVWKGREWRRIFLSAIEHADDHHLYYNMISFLSKARTLEPRYGSQNFAMLLAIITSLTSAFYVALGLCCANFLHDAYYLQVCAIGFSGVVFALKVITTMEISSYSQTNIMGFSLPSKYAPWAELVLIHVMVPNSSFMGHLAGILAGLSYTSTPVGYIVDSFIQRVTGHRIYHEWTSTRRFRRY